jgi:hypothetical protein
MDLSQRRSWGAGHLAPFSSQPARWTASVIVLSGYTQNLAKTKCFAESEPFRQQSGLVFGTSRGPDPEISENMLGDVGHSTRRACRLAGLAM